MFSLEKAWKYIIPCLIVSLILIYGLIALISSYTFRSTSDDIKTVLAIRKSELSPIMSLTEQGASVSTHLINNHPAYSDAKLHIALSNWRPLTVRLAGYLGGTKNVSDGVFDMDTGIQLALHQGARAFVFDIDYLETRPCTPVIIHRDDTGVMRSLNTGSIKDGCTALANRAFTVNYDPVLVIVYIRRLPTGTKQKEAFFKNIATSLDPLSIYHLGSNAQGDYHGCKQEDSLFRSSITNFQKQFIVLTNYNTSTLKTTSNPKENLHFWTHARIYQDSFGVSSSLGSVTPTVANGITAYATVGQLQSLMNIPSDQTTGYMERARDIFRIAMPSVDYKIKITDLSKLLNTLGIQCVPLDVVRLSIDKNHSDTLGALENGITKVAAIPSDLSIGTSKFDPLSFWRYAGWSHKNTAREGFQNPPVVPVATSKPILGFVIPKPIVPKKPPPSTNSNGGLVNIA